jgi:hypothetical protein
MRVYPRSFLGEAAATFRVALNPARFAASPPGLGPFQTREHREHPGALQHQNTVSTPAGVTIIGRSISCQENYTAILHIKILSYRI